MITDKDTNIVYFSELLKSNPKYTDTCKRITDVLDANHVIYKFLPCTKDIWARDYMPIQISKDKFIEYRYDPDYLQGIEIRRREVKTYPDMVCDALNLKTIKTDIILDGGNVIKSSQSVILTDKIFIENKRSYKSKELIEKLKQLFEVEKVIIIPWDIPEEYGHADGMLRFINENTVFINGYFDHYNNDFKNKLFGTLDENGIICKKLSFNVPKADKRNWAYINYLQTKDIILLPKFGIDEDEQALEQFKEQFKEYAANNKIIQLEIPEIVKNNGAFNCISWNILAA